MRLTGSILSSQHRRHKYTMTNQAIGSNIR